MNFLRKSKAFSGANAESEIGVSNSLDGFRELAELTLKVSPSMETKMIRFP